MVLSETNPYLVASILLILVPGIIFMNFYQGYWWDEVVYLGLAKSIASGGGYQINIGDEAHRPPFFPFFASFFISFGEGSIRFISILFGAVSVLITYLFAKKLYNRKIALLSAMFLATSHFFLFFGQKILTETIFIALSTGALYFFYLGIEENRKYLPLAGILTGMSFLTRYPGILLIPIFFIYLLLRWVMSRKKKDYNVFLSRLLSKEFALAVVIFILILIPWLWNSQVAFGDIFGSLREQSVKATSEPQAGMWYYYLRHGIEIFGFVIIFAIPALFFMIYNKKKGDMLVLTTVVMVLLFFSFLVSKKEMRWIFTYGSIFFIFSAVGVQRFGEWIKKERLIIAIAVLFSLFSFSVGLQIIYYDLDSGKAMVSAGKWLGNNTEPNSYIIAENYPVLNYVSGRKVFMFPKNEVDFYEHVRQYKITYYILDKWEPTTPVYARDIPSQLVVEFNEPSGQTVSIYKLTQS